MRTPYEVLSGGESGIRTHGRSHVTGFQELKSSQALFSKLNIFCNFTCIFADISPTAVSRNYYSKWENYCQKLKKFHFESNIHLHMDNYFFRPFFELLVGQDYVRKMINQGKSEEEIRACWQEDVAKFKEQRRAYLLYEE